MTTHGCFNPNPLNGTYSFHSEEERDIGKVKVLMAVRKWRMASLGGLLWNEVPQSPKVDEIVGFSQERNMLFAGRNKSTKALVINR